MNLLEFNQKYEVNQHLVSNDKSKIFDEKERLDSMEVLLNR